MGSTGGVASFSTPRPSSASPSRKPTSIVKVTTGGTWIAPKQPQLEAPIATSPISTGRNETSIAIPTGRASRGSSHIAPTTVSSTTMLNFSTKPRSMPSGPSHWIRATGRCLGEPSTSLSTAPVSSHRGTTTRASTIATLAPTVSLIEPSLP